MKNKKLSDLLFDKPAKGFRVKDIKDFSLVHKIFEAYREARYDWMAKEIFFYSSFWFFRDLSIYLGDRYKSDILSRFYYLHIVDEYLARELWLFYQRNIYKSRKQK